MRGFAAGGHLYPLKKISHSEHISSEAPSICARGACIVRFKGIERKTRFPPRLRASARAEHVLFSFMGIERYLPAAPAAAAAVRGPPFFLKNTRLDPPDLP